jgi:hypothetical protein
MKQQVKQTIVSAAVVSALGITGVTFSTAASASLVIDGNYALEIIPTPVKTTTYGATSFKIAPPTGLESSFTFGVLPSNADSKGMTNNGFNVTLINDFSSFYGSIGDPGVKGTSDSTDGVAGRIVFDVVGGTIGNASAFSVDNIFGTSGGNFSQLIAGGDLSGFAGSIDNNGVMDFIMPGRFGAIDGPTGGVVGPWNFDSRTGLLEGFTTGTSNDSGIGTINGVDCTGSSGSYSCTLVSGGQVGPAWGTFNGNPFYEVWKINLTRLGDATVIPVPAAVWLFGSGLLGLVGIARRKKQV